MDAGRSTNRLIQTKSTNKLSELIYLRIYQIQSIITRIILIRVSSLSFTIRGTIGPSH